MSASPGGELAARIARIDAQRSRLGLAAAVMAFSAVAMTALGLAASGPLRVVAFALLAAGALCIAARLRLAWTRVALARELVRRDAAALLDPSSH